MVGAVPPRHSGRQGQQIARTLQRRIPRGQLPVALELLKGRLNRSLSRAPPRHQAYGRIAIETAVPGRHRNRLALSLLQATQVPRGMRQLGAKRLLHHSGRLNLLTPLVLNRLDLVQWRQSKGGLVPGSQGQSINRRSMGSNLHHFYTRRKGGKTIQAPFTSQRAESN